LIVLLTLPLLGIFLGSLGMDIHWASKTGFYFTMVCAALPWVLASLWEYTCEEPQREQVDVLYPFVALINSLSGAISK
jgi:hypothetical protein